MGSKPIASKSHATSHQITMKNHSPKTLNHKNLYYHKHHSTCRTSTEGICSWVSAESTAPPPCPVCHRPLQKLSRLRSISLIDHAKMPYPASTLIKSYLDLLTVALCPKMARRVISSSLINQAKLASDIHYTNFQSGISINIWMRFRK